MKNFDYLYQAVNAKIALSSISDELSEFSSLTKTDENISPELEKRKQALRRRFEKLLKSYLDIEEKAVKELESIKDGNLMNIVRWKYLCGYTWAQIADKYPEKPTVDAVKKRFQRYLKEYENGR